MQRDTDLDITGVERITRGIDLDDRLFKILDVEVELPRLIRVVDLHGATNIVGDDLVHLAFVAIVSDDQVDVTVETDEAKLVLLLRQEVILGLNRITGSRVTHVARPVVDLPGQRFEEDVAALLQSKLGAIPRQTVAAAVEDGEVGTVDGQVVGDGYVVTEEPVVRQGVPCSGTITDFEVAGVNLPSQFTLVQGRVVAGPVCRRVPAQLDLDDLCH